MFIKQTMSVPNSIYYKVNEVNEKQLLVDTFQKEAPVSITPPGVEAVKEMPLPSTSSDCSDLDSTPNFSLAEDIDRSKVTITDDPEQSLDISAATQGSRMVTAVEVC